RVASSSLVSRSTSSSSLESFLRSTTPPVEVRSAGSDGSQPPRKARRVASGMGTVSMTRSTTRRDWLRRLGALALLLGGVVVVGRLLLARADGPVLIFAGGPLRSGERVALDALDWTA